MSKKNEKKPAPKGSADHPSPHEFKVKPHPGAKPGEWQGEYQPVTPKFNVARVLREIKGKEK